MCKLEKKNEQHTSFLHIKCATLKENNDERMATTPMPQKNKQLTKGAIIARAIMDEYQPQTKEDIHDAIKDIFGPMFEALLQGEMDAHLGYSSNARGEKNTTDRRNGYSHKSVNTSFGQLTAVS